MHRPAYMLLEMKSVRVETMNFVLLDTLGTLGLKFTVLPSGLPKP